MHLDITPSLPLAGNVGLLRILRVAAERYCWKDPVKPPLRQLAGAVVWRRRFFIAGEKAASPLLCNSFERFKVPYLQTSPSSNLDSEEVTPIISTRDVQYVL